MTEKRTPVQGKRNTITLIKCLLTCTFYLIGSIHKRAPQRPATVPTDIYISSKSKSNAIIKRVTRLMLKEK